MSSPSCPAEADRKEEEKEGEDKSQARSIRDRRRPREKRRSTGVSFWTQDVRTSVCNRINACNSVESIMLCFLSLKGGGERPGPAVGF